MSVVTVSRGGLRFPASQPGPALQIHVLQRRRRYSLACPYRDPADSEASLNVCWNPRDLFRVTRRELLLSESPPEYLLSLFVFFHFLLTTDLVFLITSPPAVQALFALSFLVFPPSCSSPAALRVSISPSPPQTVPPVLHNLFLSFFHGTSHAQEPAPITPSPAFVSEKATRSCTLRTIRTHRSGFAQRWLN